MEKQIVSKPEVKTLPFASSTLQSREKHTDTLAFTDNRVQFKKLASTISAINGGVVQREKIGVETFIDMCMTIISNIRSDLRLAEKDRCETYHPLKLMELQVYLERQLSSLAGVYASESIDDANYNALLLSSTINTLSECVTLKQTIPQLIPVVATHLIDHFQKLIKSKISDEDVVDKAKVLCSDNPIEIYAKNVLPLKEVVPIIKDMATRSAIPCDTCINMLVNQLKTRVLVLNKKDVPQIAAPSATYGNITFTPSDVCGFTSLAFYEYLNGESDSYRTNYFEVNTPFVERINKLSLACQVPSNGDAPDILEAGQHILPLSASNFNEKYPNLAGLIKNAKPTITPLEVATVITDFEKYLKEKCKVWIGIPYATWFKDDHPVEKWDYQSMIAQIEKKVNIQEMIDGPNDSEIHEKRGDDNPDSSDKFSILDLSNAMKLQNRSAAYPAWRVDKDLRAAGKKMDFSEFPIYGYLGFWDEDTFGIGHSTGYGAIHVALSIDFVENNSSRIRYKGGVNLPEYEDVIEMIDKTLDMTSSDSDNCCAGALLNFLYGLAVTPPLKEMEVVIYGGKYNLIRDTDPELIIGYPEKKDDEGLTPEQVDVVTSWARRIRKFVRCETNKSPEDHVEPNEINYKINDLFPDSKSAINNMYLISAASDAIKDVINCPIWGDPAPDAIELIKGMNSSSCAFLGRSISMVRKLNHSEDSMVQEFFNCFHPMFDEDFIFTKLKSFNSRLNSFKSKYTIV